MLKRWWRPKTELKENKYWTVYVIICQNSLVSIHIQVAHLLLCILRKYIQSARCVVVAIRRFMLLMDDSSPAGRYLKIYEANVCV